MMSALGNGQYELAGVNERPRASASLPCSRRCLTTGREIPASYRIPRPQDLTGGTHSRSPGGKFS